MVLLILIPKLLDVCGGASGCVEVCCDMGDLSIYGG